MNSAQHKSSQSKTIILLIPTLDEDNFNTVEKIIQMSTTLYFTKYLQF
jgi:hypothetical protein